jgi:hypothetical protein
MKTNPNQTGSNSGRVLQDHLKKGSIFFLPLTCNASGPLWNLIKWRADFLPELVWIAQLANDFGYDKANELACALAVTTTNVAVTSGDFGAVTGYSNLTPESKASICGQLQKDGVLNEIVRSLAPLLCLYPSCPLRFLLDGKPLEISADEAAEKLAPVIAQCLNRTKKLPMLAQGIHYNTRLATGRLTDPQPLNTAALKEYPNTPESLMVGGFVRADTTGLSFQRLSGEWPKYFWRHGVEIGPCVSEDCDDGKLHTFSEDFILYQMSCFKRYSERCNELWMTVQQNYRFDLYAPLRDEILLALVARIYRVTIQIVSFFANWTEDISETYLRMVVESYIYYQWLVKKGTAADFEKFYEHGLGQQKLQSEHLNRFLQSAGLTEKEAREQNAGLDFLRKHKMPEFILVNVGNPLGKNLNDIAKEVDEVSPELACKNLYSLIFSPASSAVHGMYDSLEKFYMKQCVNPFHGGHKIPYYWSKSPITSYGFSNCLGITDSVLADLIKSVGGSLPKEMPGDLFMAELYDTDKFETFKQGIQGKST